MNYQYTTPQQGSTTPSQNYIQQQTPASRAMAYAPGNWNARIRPVSSIEEVRASPIDFDGSIFYFPDIANKCIYTKFINIDGTVGVNTYELKEISAGQAADSSYITREEFEESVIQLKNMYQQIEDLVLKQQENNSQQHQTSSPALQF